MSMVSDQSESCVGGVLEEISRDECVRLLGTVRVGRIAVAEFGSAPFVVPVNFVFDGEAIVFRSDYGTKFRLAVLSERPVSFEVDYFEAGCREGWSVLIRGYAFELDLDDEVDRPDVRPWASGEKSHWIRVLPDEITGRRVRLPGMPAFDGRAYL